MWKCLVIMTSSGASVVASVQSNDGLAAFDRGKEYIIRKEYSPFDIELDQNVLSAPGMLSNAERKLLYLIASRFWRGVGAVIDGGSFFGSSVYAIAAGLKANPQVTAILQDMQRRGEKPITAYELGYLPAPKSDKIDRRRVFGGQPYVLGESFVHILENAISPYRDLIDLRIGDFMQQSWPADRKIELCFIDLAKTKELNVHIVKTLFPHFIPGTTHLIHQDFYFDRLPWIKITMGYLRDYFEWLGQVGSSSVYRCIAAIPPKVCQYDPYTMGSSEEKLALHRLCEADYLPERRRLMLAISYCYLLALVGRQAEALQRLDQLEATYPHLIVPGGPMKVVRTERARRQIKSGRMNM